MLEVPAQGYRSRRDRERKGRDQGIRPGPILRYKAIKALGPGALELPARVVAECLLIDDVVEFARELRRPM